MKNSIGNHFENFTQDTKEAINHSLEYYKLDLLKKTALSLISGGQFIIKAGILVLILLFLSIGLSFLIGNQLGSVSHGFFIVGGVYIILLILINLLGKKLLEKPVLKFLNKILNSGDKLDEELKQDLTKSSDL
ncbi:phage holin family protein [Psychroflexus sp. CAK57W]|uniref:phage holin family protein n=1 Tax=Psychroflexus curvus TaxID=2873595 RepID=UPI001CC9F11F|nr:phage holin family protein [Psychroflexus curvus]MBZ9626918.1 phage holin family protein [Psychroflexus curvus]MBZ9786911.1 phage holin family protein [Psychroflexus curvus]